MFVPSLDVQYIVRTFTSPAAGRAGVVLTEYMERLMSASLGDFWSEALLHPTVEDFPFKKHPDFQVRKNLAGI